MNQRQESKPAFEAARKHTVRYAKRLLAIVKQHAPGYSFAGSKGSQSDQNKINQDSSRLLTLLSFIPYLLTLTFIVSFFWDFNGLSITFWNHTYFFEGLLRILSVGGLIGFLTNWIAITMLFKPVKKHPLLGQGMIPANKNRIAFRLAQTVSEDIIDPKTIKQNIHQSNLIRNYRQQSSIYLRQMIGDPRFRRELKQWILRYIKNMIDDPEIRAAIAQKIIEQIESSIEEGSFEQFAIKTYSYFTDSKMQHIVEESLRSLPDSVESELRHLDRLLDDIPYKIEANSETIEEWITNILYKLINQLNVHSLVENKLKQYDEQQLSDLISNATSDQLRFIKYLGGVLGIIGGFVIWAPVASLISLVILAFIIILIDNVLLNLG